jgi:hypothetical protein
MNEPGNPTVSSSIIFSVVSRRHVDLARFCQKTLLSALSSLRLGR